MNYELCYSLRQSLRFATSLWEGGKGYLQNQIYRQQYQTHLLSPSDPSGLSEQTENEAETIRLQKSF